MEALIPALFLAFFGMFAAYFLAQRQVPERRIHGVSDVVDDVLACVLNKDGAETAPNLEQLMHEAMATRWQFESPTFRALALTAIGALHAQKSVSENVHAAFVAALNRAALVA